MDGAFDSHSHFGEDYEAVLGRAVASGMAGLIAVGGDAALNDFARKAVEARPGFAHLAAGFDRSMCEKISPEDAVAALERRLKDVATPLEVVGEIGLDYFYGPETAAKQLALFEAQLAFAKERELPVSIHSRDADDDTLAALSRHAGVRGILHCFTGSQKFADAVLEAGLHVSFSGIVTFRNADPLRAVAKTIPDERLLVETDCPFLAPAPLRGRRNEPAFVERVIALLAELRESTPERIAALTASNARALLGI